MKKEREEDKKLASHLLSAPSMKCSKTGSTTPASKNQTINKKILKPAKLTLNSSVSHPLLMVSDVYKSLKL